MCIRDRCKTPNKKKVEKAVIRKKEYSFVCVLRWRKILIFTKLYFFLSYYVNVLYEFSFKAALLSMYRNFKTVTSFNAASPVSVIICVVAFQRQYAMTLRI